MIWKDLRDVTTLFLLSIVIIIIIIIIIIISHYTLLIVPSHKSLSMFSSQWPMTAVRSETTGPSHTAASALTQNCWQLLPGKVLPLARRLEICRRQTMSSILTLIKWPESVVFYLATADNFKLPVLINISDICLICIIQPISLRLHRNFWETSMKLF